MVLPGNRLSFARVARSWFDDRALDAIFEIGRGNLRATDDLAFKSLDHAAAAGHAAVSVQHVIAARKDLEDGSGCDQGAQRSGSN